MVSYEFLICGLLVQQLQSLKLIRQM